jgi:hypothetical protein
MMKAMGTECDQEIVQLVGSDDFYQVTFECVLYTAPWRLMREQLELAASLAEAANLDVFTQLQVVFYTYKLILPVMMMMMMMMMMVE